MIIKEAIILAGGLGTRLRSAVPDLPKCMAPVNGRPFISYLIDSLLHQQVENIIFSLGYKHEVIEDYVKQQYPGLQYQTVIEREPLGTGGAIRLACKTAVDTSVLVFNGDTYFDVDLKAFSAFHQDRTAHCTIALKPMRNVDRYGIVELDEDSSIRTFKEKDEYEAGMINGGVYALDVNSFLEEELPDRFSFELDYLQKYHSERRMYGFREDGYFIDIGIPADFQKAQTDFREKFPPA